MKRFFATIRFPDQAKSVFRASLATMGWVLMRAFLGHNPSLILQDWWIYLLLLPFFLLFFTYTMAGIKTWIEEANTRPSYKALLALFLFFFSLDLVSLVNLTSFQPSFWDRNFLQVPLLILLGFAYLGYLFLKKNRRTNFLDQFAASHRLVLTSLLTSHHLTVIYFKERFLVDFEVGRFFPSLPLILLEFVLLYVLTYWGVGFLPKVLEDLGSKKASWASAIGLSFILAMILSLSYQLSLGQGGDYWGLYLFPGALTFQLSFLILINMSILAICNRQILGSLIMILLNLSLIIANAIKFRLRSEPLTPSDLKWLSDFDLVVSFVSPQLVWMGGLVLLALTLLAIFLSRRYFKGKIWHSLKPRFLILAMTATVFVGLGSLLRTEKDNKIYPYVPIVSILNNWSNVNWQGYTLNARFRGLSFLWLQQLSKESMEQPSSYSAQKLAQIQEKYSKRAQEINKSRSQKLSDQTVVFVLSESLSNPNRLDGISLNQELLPHIDTIKSQTTSGLMTSSHYGGGTANVEFQAYSGLPFSNFSPSISAVYLDVLPQMSRIPVISDLYPSQNRLALHPYYETSYNRKTIYQLMGYHQFWSLDSRSYPLEVSDEDLYGQFVSDSYLYQKTLAVIKDQPQFISLMTMQNHSPWDYTSDNPDLLVSGTNFTDDEVSKLSNYANLLQKTDQATKDFLDSLAQLDEKVTVVFYGDHLPGFYPEAVFANNPDSKYQTDYFIWSNYQTEKQNYDQIKPTDFPALLMQETNSKVSPYLALLTDVLNKEDGAEEALLLVQYDLVAGQGYLANEDDFFQVSD